jgi:hypothetical protein
MTLKIGLRFGRRLTVAGTAVLLGAGLVGAGALGAGVASASTAGAVTGQQSTAPAAAVPWGSVGAGWVLTRYSTGTPSKPEPTTLYLVSPSGAKYPIDTWKAGATVPSVIAWAGDKTQALLYVSIPRTNAPAVTKYSELNLETGKQTALTLAGNANPLGYTLPTGQQILGETANPAGNANAKITLARYTQAGKLVKALITEKGSGISALYSPNGAALALAAPAAVSLLSNAGGTPKKLPVPGVNTSSDCSPVRWWNASTILADCEPKNDLDIPQLWLVPASGAKPSALTPVRKSGADLGDIDAWQLSSGLYLQSLGACGSLEINKQASNGSITSVTVPGTNQSPIVVTASSSRLLVRTGGCFNGGELVWFNPGTRAEQWLFKTGVQEVTAYTNEENA